MDQPTLLYGSRASTSLPWPQTPWPQQPKTATAGIWVDTDNQDRAIIVLTDLDSIATAEVVQVIPDFVQLSLAATSQGPPRQQLTASDLYRIAEITLISAGIQMWRVSQPRR